MQVSLRDLEGKQTVKAINGEGQPRYRLSDDAQHEVTLSTGPNFDSQREEGSAFVDTFVANMKNLPLAPEQATQVLALLVKLKQLGPIGDKIEEVLGGGDEQKKQIPPEAQAAMAQMQQQTRALNAYAQQLEAQLAEMKQKLDGKQLESDTRKQIAALQAQVDVFRAKLDAALKHEELASKENIEAAKMRETGMEHRDEMRAETERTGLERDKAAVDAEIKRTAEGNKASIAMRQADIAEKAANRPKEAPK